VAPTGLTGATSATRFVGGTVSGSPITGAFLKGDFVIDQSGSLWVCITAGSPGSWNVAPTPSTYTPALVGISSVTFSSPIVSTATEPQRPLLSPSVRRR
jgi:hypothetical protein